MHTVHGRGADLIFFCNFGHSPILVQMNIQHSQAQLYSICTHGASHREAVSNIFKVFGMTRPWVGYNTRPHKL